MLRQRCLMSNIAQSQKLEKGRSEFLIIIDQTNFCFIFTYSIKASVCQYIYRYQYNMGVRVFCEVCEF